MTRILYDATTATLHPYPRTDDEPVVGLDPHYLVMELIQQPQPEHDPATHRLEPTEVIDIETLTVTRGWQLMELPPYVSSPDWNSFMTTALNSSTLKSILAQVYQVEPIAASALAPALLRAETHGPEVFSVAWSTICSAVSVPPEVIAGFQETARACHLPESFIDALHPNITEENI